MIPVMSINKLAIIADRCIDQTGVSL